MQAAHSAKICRAEPPSLRVEEEPENAKRNLKSRSHGLIPGRDLCCSQLRKHRTCG